MKRGVNGFDFKFQTRFTTNETGLIKGVVNGNRWLITRASTPISRNEQTGYVHRSRFYFNMGLYRDLMAEPMTIYIDEYRKRNCPIMAFDQRHG